MSRTWKTKKESDGWIMECDSCFVRTSDARPHHNDLPLIEFASLGWSIGTHSDRCPDCVKKHGPYENALSHERLMENLKHCRDHCLKYYGRDPLSPAMLALAVGDGS